MSLPVTEAFTNADGTSLPTHNAAWVDVNAGLLITSNSVYGSDSLGSAYYSGETWSNDQYAQLVVVAVSSSGASRSIGPSCRQTAGATDTAYVFAWYSTAAASQRRLYKVVAGTITELGSDTTVASAGEVFRVEAQGTTVRGKVNGVEIFSVTDSAIASGVGGIRATSSNTSHRGDNWEAGDLTAAGASHSKLASRKLVGKLNGKAA